MRPPRIDNAMKRDALLSSAFFKPMRPAEIDEIIGFAAERRFPRGTTVFTKGQPGSSMMAVLVGRIRVGSISSEGKEVTLNVIGPGEVVGEIALLDGKPRSADAVAIEDTTVIVVERRDFLPFMLRHETLVERVLTVLCDRLRRTSSALEEIALFEVPARLARVVLKLAEDYGRPQPDGSTRITIKLSQRDLSNLVASSRESVNKQLRVWRDAHVVDLVDGHLVVLKQAALQAEAGG